MQKLQLLSKNNFEESKEQITIGKGHLQSLIKEAINIQNKCEDSEKVVMSSLKLNRDLSLTYNNGEQERNRLLTSFAFSQLCAKLGLPVRYIKKCISEEKIDLAISNFNQWTQHEGLSNKSLLIREYDSKYIRGALSDRYSICDTPTILTAIDESGIVEDMRMKGRYISADRLHVRFVGDKLDVPNEDLFAGVVINSSDVGRSKLTVDFFVWKQICTNGLKIIDSSSNLFTQKHVGIELETLTESLKDFDLTAVIENATTIIKQAQATSTFKSSELDDVREILKASELVGNKLSEQIIEVAEDRYSLNQWGITNAITDVAKNYSLEKRLQLEEYAGVFMSRKVA